MYTPPNPNDEEPVPIRPRHVLALMMRFEGKSYKEIGVAIGRRHVLWAKAFLTGKWALGVLKRMWDRQLEAVAYARAEKDLVESGILLESAVTRHHLYGEEVYDEPMICLSQKELAYLMARGKGNPRVGLQLAIQADWFLYGYDTPKTRWAMRQAQHYRPPKPTEQSGGSGPLFFLAPEDIVDRSAVKREPLS